MNESDRKILLNFANKLNKELINAVYKTFEDYDGKDLKVIMKYFNTINFEMINDVLTGNINTNQTNQWKRITSWREKI